MKLIDTTCPHCGSALKIDPTNKNATCEYCGAALLIDDEVQHVQYDNAEEAGYKFEKGRQRAQAEVQRSSQRNTQYKQKPPKKKRKTWLWVLGWICIFPLPLTILLLRKKDMKPVLKYGIIAAAWIIYLLIGFAGGSGDTEKTANEPVSTPAVVESTETDSEDTQDNEEPTVTETESVEEPDESNSDDKTQDVQTIYPDNKNINNFIADFNQMYPEYSLLADDLTKYYHHGREHDDQVKTTINGVPVIISGEGFSKKYNISVYWDNPTKGSADGNLEMFRMIMHVFAPDLTDEQIDIRWQDTIDDLTHTVEWDDGIEFWPGSNLTDVDGNYEYVKIIG